MQPHAFPRLIPLVTLALTCSLLSFALNARAEVTLAPIFGDHMVLQRDLEIPVWGTAAAMQEVTVTLGDQTARAKADGKGKWKARLKAPPASMEPTSMKIACGDSTVELKDILIGDVWLCSGQSNMAFKLSSCTNGKEDAAAASDTALRVNLVSGWQNCGSAVAPRTSGVAFYFASKLRRATPEVPIGLIIRAVGGTPIEYWTPREKLERVAFCKEMIAKFGEGSEWGKIFSDYKKAQTAWKKKVAADGRKQAGKPPTAPASPDLAIVAGIYSANTPGRLWSQHLAPLAGYGIRGAIWYQGERNSKAGEASAKAYRAMLANMITSWREAWGQGDFPFYAVQLPTFAKGGPNWTLLQQSQAAAVADVPNAGYADIRDLPDGGLHPKDKKPVGERLADLALD